MAFYVYLLLSSNGATYVGATINLDRRLEQHNKFLKGGAKATNNRVERGELWIRVCHIKNFPDWKSALQFEWRWKQISRKINGSFTSPLHKRVKSLKILLNMEKSTNNAISFREWEFPPEVICEDDEFKELWNNHSNI